MNTPTTLAVGSLGTLAIFGILLFFIPIPDKNAQIAGAVIGYVAAMSQVAGSYFFGSSKSSTQKDETISAMVKTGKGAVL